MTQAIDHRPRVNAERREKTRRRLIEAAMFVVSQKGIEGSQINDVMEAADVSRGGFYGHFSSMAELLNAIGAELANETIMLIEKRVTGISDPAERIASGITLYLQIARKYPQFARFVVAAGNSVTTPHNLIYDLLPPHIEAASAAGKMEVMSPQSAVDLIAGGTLIALMRISQGQIDEAYCSDVVAGLLMGLGVKRTTARALSSIKVDAITPPNQSLLHRTHHAGNDYVGNLV